MKKVDPVSVHLVLSTAVLSLFLSFLTVTDFLFSVCVNVLFSRLCVCFFLNLVFIARVRPLVKGKNYRISSLNSRSSREDFFLLLAYSENYRSENKRDFGQLLEINLNSKLDYQGARR